MTVRGGGPPIPARWSSRPARVWPQRSFTASSTGLLSYDAPVAQYWPEFGANGKSAITVRDMMGHRAGLSHLKGVSKEELLDHRLMEERVAAAPADRRLVGRSAYQAFTYGWLASGLLERSRGWACGN